MTLTAIVIIAAAIILIAYDTWTVLRNGVQSTISWVLYSAAQKYPIIPFLFGGLMGHLFFPNCGG